MYKYFTDIIQKECKQERSFVKWLEDVAKQAKELAYENRRTIYKRELEQEINEIKSFRYAYKPLKALIKKGKVTDLIIKVSREGYAEFILVFPISKEEFDQAWENRRKRIKELGEYGSLCVDFDNCLCEVCRDRVHKMLPFLDLYDGESYPYYQKYGSDGLQRKVQVFRAFNKK